MERIEGNDLMAVLPKFIEGAAFGSLNTVLSHFLGGDGKDGYALPSHFEVLISPPGMGLPDSEDIDELSDDELAQIAARQSLGANGLSKKISLRCESISLPGMNLTSSIDPGGYSVQPQVVDGVSFAETINMTFQSSSDLEERVLFERWQELAWDRANWNIRYYDQYTGSVEIYILDMQKNKKYGVKLYDCYPKTVSDVALNFAPATDIVKINVAMQYKYWETMNIKAQPRSLGDKLLDNISGGIERSINANIPNVLSKLG
jgi:hypothetical protein